jgi:hypothetical protein
MNDDARVKGVWYRIEDALKFCFGVEQKLEFVVDPSNPHDSNAIRIYGHFLYKGERRTVLLGYVDRDMARIITQNRLQFIVYPVLKSIYVSDYTDRVHIYYRIFYAKDMSAAHHTYVYPGVPDTYEEIPDPVQMFPLVKLVIKNIVKYSVIGLLRLIYVPIGLVKALAVGCYHDLADYDQRKPGAVKLIARLALLSLMVGVVAVMSLKIIGCSRH